MEVFAPAGSELLGDFLLEAALCEAGDLEKGDRVSVAMPVWKQIS